MPAVVGGLFTEVYLAVGKAALTDSLSFMDGTVAFASRAYTVPMRTVALSGGVSLPGGLDLGNAGGARTVTIPLIVQAATADATIAAVQAIQKKIQQARRAKGTTGLSTKVYLWVRQLGASNYDFFVVEDGAWRQFDSGQPAPDRVLAGVLTLQCLPYALGDLTSDSASATLSNGTASLYRAGVLGDVEALQRLIITDVSTNSKIIQQVRLFRRSLQGMGSADFTPNYDAVSSAPGADHADATALGGTASRITASTAWQTFAKVASAGGPYNNGEFNLWGRVKSSATPIGQPVAGAAATTLLGGNLRAGVYSYIAVPRDGSGNKGTPSGVMSVFTYGSVAGVNTLSNDDFEANNPSNWDRRGAGTASVVTTGAAAMGGSYGLRVTTDTTASSATARRPVLALPATKQLSTQVLVKPRQFNGSATPSAFLALGGFFVLLNGSTGAVTFQSPFGTSVSGSTTFGLNTQYRCELLYDGTGPIGQVSLYVNGVLIAAANDDATVPAYPTYVQLVGVGASGTASIIDYDNFMFADGLLGTAATGVGASNAVTWTNGVNTTDIYLYMQFTPVGQPPGPWYRLDVGNVGSYTHSVQIPSAAVLESPPIALPTQQPAEVRVQYGAAGSAATLITAPAMPCVLNNSKWEDVWLGTIELPPVVAAQDQTSPAWVFYLQGKCPGSNTPTIDCDGFWLMPADEDSVTLTARSVLGAQVKWQADITSEGRVSCQLLSKADGSLVDTAAVVGQFTLGPGDNLIGVQMEMSDGAGNLVSDIVDLKCTLTPSITPRYTDLRQAA